MAMLKHSKVSWVSNACVRRNRFLVTSLLRVLEHPKSSSVCVCLLPLSSSVRPSVRPVIRPVVVVRAAVVLCPSAFR